MISLLQLIRKTEQVVVLLALLFALAPCTVKAPLLETLKVEHLKPLNRSKATTSSVDSCKHSFENEETGTLASTPHLIGLPVRTQNISHNHEIQAESNHNEPTRFAIELNALPLYLLFKRLKVDLA